MSPSGRNAYGRLTHYPCGVGNRDTHYGNII